MRSSSAVKGCSRLLAMTPMVCVCMVRRLRAAALGRYPQLRRDRVDAVNGARTDADAAPPAIEHMGDGSGGGPPPPPATSRMPIALATPPRVTARSLHAQAF